MPTIAMLNNDGHKKEILISAIKMVLEDLVHNNGIWDNGVFDMLEIMGIENQQFHHTYLERKVWELADRLYEKLINLA